MKVMNYWGNLVKEGAVAVDDDFKADWGHHIGNDRYAAMVGAGWSPTYMVDAYLPAGSTPGLGRDPDAAMDRGWPCGGELGRVHQRGDQGLPVQPGKRRRPLCRLHQQLQERPGHR